MHFFLFHTCVLSRLHSDLRPLLNTFGLYFQIRDDLANLVSVEV
jgi:geranylgeranyl pyrophosphate synthase